MTKIEELQEKIARIEANLKIAKNPVVVEAAEKKLAELQAQIAELEAGEGSSKMYEFNLTENGLKGQEMMARFIANGFYFDPKFWIDKVDAVLKDANNLALSTEFLPKSQYVQKFVIALLASADPDKNISEGFKKAFENAPQELKNEMDFSKWELEGHKFDMQSDIQTPFKDTEVGKNYAGLRPPYSSFYGSVVFSHPAYQKLESSGKLNKMVDERAEETAKHQLLAQMYHLPKKVISVIENIEKKNTFNRKKKYLNLAQKRQKKNWGSFFIHSEPMTETIANKMVKALKGKAKISDLRNDSVDLEISPLTNPKTAHKAIFDLAKKENWHIRGGVNDLLDENLPKQPKLRKNAEGKIDHQKSEKKADAPTLDKNGVIAELDSLLPELNLPFWGKNSIDNPINVQYVNSLINYLNEKFDIGEKVGGQSIKSIVIVWLDKANSKAKVDSKKGESLEKLKAELKELKAENKELQAEGNGEVPKVIEDALKTANKALSPEGATFPKSATNEEKAEIVKEKADKKLEAREARKENGGGETKTKSLAEKVASPFLADFRKDYKTKVADTKASIEKKIETVREIVEKHKEDAEKKWIKSIKTALDKQGEEYIKALTKKAKNNEE